MGFTVSEEGDMRFRSLALLASLGFVVAGLAASTASANHAWSKYHWARTANPFTIKLGDNVTAAWDDYLTLASSDWSASTVMDTPVVPGSTTGATCAATAGRVEVCNAAYGATGWLGVAQISISRGRHITQGTAKVNDTYYTTGSKYDTAYWRAHVMCQEVGHDFGLGHQDESGADLHTCMDYYNMAVPHEHTKHPNQHDYDQLVDIYSHLDPSTTISAGAAANPNAAPVAIERSDRISNTIIHEHFKDGSERLTHIYWALP